MKTFSCLNLIVSTLAAMLVSTSFCEAQANFRITSIEKSASNLTVKFPTTSGVNYYIQGSGNLQTWTQVATTVGTGAEATVLLSGQGVGTAKFFRVTTLAPAPPGFSFIPATTFTMGEQSNMDPPLVGGAPAHTVTLSSYYMAQKEVTYGEWQTTYSYAITNGYGFSNVGSGKAADHPVHTISWHDAVKWCNARSRQEGLQACYVLNTQNGAEFKTGTPGNIYCNFTRNGYRLPTESEWENAARGGAVGLNFPWGNTITHSNANYTSDTFYAYDVSPTRGAHPLWRTTGNPKTSPGGSFPANGYGLYDMTGNVKEWCYDQEGPYPDSGAVNPIGPEEGSAFATRMLRGGSWFAYANHALIATRINQEPIVTSQDFGFRVARSGL